MLLLTLWRLATFGDFRKKKRLNTRGFAWNISAPVRVTDLFEASKDAASLLVCTLQNFFAWGV